MQIHAQLSFSGQCEEAFTWYARVLHGTVLMMLRYGESPMADQVPHDWRHKIVHARLDVNGSQLTGSDAPRAAYQRPCGVSLVVNLADQTEAARVFQGLAEKGSVQLPMQPTFWSPAYGAVVDQFGIPWEVNCTQAPQDV